MYRAFGIAILAMLLLLGSTFPVRAQSASGYYFSSGRGGRFATGGYRSDYRGSTAFGFGSGGFYFSRQTYPSYGYGGYGYGYDPLVALGYAPMYRAGDGNYYDVYQPFCLPAPPPPCQPSYRTPAYVPPVYAPPLAYPPETGLDIECNRCHAQYRYGTVHQCR